MREAYLRPMHSMCKAVKVEQHDVLGSCKQPSIGRAGTVTKEADGSR